MTLQEAFPTIVNIAAPDYAQDLFFEKLFMYYAANEIALKTDSFERSQNLETRMGNTMLWRIYYRIKTRLLSNFQYLG